MGQGSDAAERTWGFGQGGSFEGVDGIEIRYRCFPASGARPGVVISNGRTEFMLKYAETVRELGAAGFAVYILDHRGQGFSGRMTADPEVGHVERFDDYVDDLASFVEHVVRPAQAEHPGGGEQPLLLLAHSMGGAIASLYLARHADVFAAAALCSPMHQIAPGGGEPLLEGVMSAVAGIGRADGYAPLRGPYRDRSFESYADRPGEAMTHDRERYEAMRRLATGHPEVRLGGPSSRWIREAVRGSRRARRDAGRIATPLLLLQAGEDGVVRPEGQREFADAAPKCRLERIDGAYHEMLIESDRYRAPVMREILAFFSAAGG